MKKNLHLLLFFLLALIPTLHAQYALVNVAPGVYLPKDTSTRNKLLCCLDSFLLQKERPNSENIYVWQDELPATSLLLDEMKGIEQNANTKDTQVFKAYLNNATLLKDSSYLLQVSYLGIKNEMPLHRATFSLLAKKEKERFYFFAPLKRNTSEWKKLEATDVTFYYKNQISMEKAKEYQYWNNFFLKKLGRADHTTIMYCCDDFQEALQIAGVAYKSDYNGSRSNSLHANELGKTISINGTFTAQFRNFDPHDMWHEKLRIVLPSHKINRPVDEGCAYLYAGSWGLSWKEVKELFKTYIKEHPDADWLELYVQGTDFRKGGEPLKISYFINALIVDKLEKEKGFAAVLELLSCGSKEKNDANYFNALEKLTGISKASFNNEVNHLIKSI